jgi:prephenate dehydratase
MASAAEAAYQGAPGAFSEEAARAWLGDAARLLPCPTLDEAFAAVADGRAERAVVPIENTLAGAVPGCADLLVRHDVHVVGERVLPIVHALIAPAGVGLTDVRKVLSHPVALAQCERFFRDRPHLEAVPVFDTAGAVAEVVRGVCRDAAAIAARRAATVYGAAVLADGIQDRTDNATRFLLVARGSGEPVWRRGHKTGLICVLQNEPGALAHALEPFATLGLNLTRIESRPTRETPFEYAFHLDLAPVDDPARLAQAVARLRAKARWLRVLGHYPVEAF